MTRPETYYKTDSCIVSNVCILGQSHLSNGGIKFLRYAGKSTK